MTVRVTVVGGANTDIIGFPEGGYLPRDSNPGHVRMSAGGVGRNVAEDLVRLGVGVRLVTAFGDDEAGAALRQQCEALDIDTGFSVLAADTPASRYLAILDSEGDLAAAVNDMRALDALVPGALDPAAFAQADAVVVDTNVPAQTVERVAVLAHAAPLVLDPVSVPKAPRAVPILGRLRAVKANLREAERLAGVVGIEAAIGRLLDAGVGWVFVTRGPDGVRCASADEELSLRAPRVMVANATGAGDAFTAGIAYSLAAGLALREAAVFASALAAITLESERAVNPGLSLDSVRARMETMTA